MNGEPMDFLYPFEDFDKKMQAMAVPFRLAMPFESLLAAEARASRLAQMEGLAAALKPPEDSIDPELVRRIPTSRPKIIINVHIHYD